MTGIDHHDVVKGVINEVIEIFERRGGKSAQPPVSAEAIYDVFMNRNGGTIKDWVLNSTLGQSLAERKAKILQEIQQQLCTKIKYRIPKNDREPRLGTMDEQPY